MSECLLFNTPSEELNQHNDLSEKNSNPANSQANIDRCKNKIIHD